MQACGSIWFLKCLMEVRLGSACSYIYWSLYIYVNMLVIWWLSLYDLFNLIIAF
jgi:hypothetical protein